MCVPNNNLHLFSYIGLVQYREIIPVKFIVGACVGGVLLLIICILLCVTVLVLYMRKTRHKNPQQQALPCRCQLQPNQQQWEHTNVLNANEEGYINDQTAPTYEIPFSSLADDGEYLQATPATGIPMDQMTGSDDYENVNMAPKNGIPFNQLAGNGEYLHTSAVEGIPMGQTNNNGDYVNTNME